MHFPKRLSLDSNRQLTPPAAHRNRRGTIIVLTALVLILLIAMVAFALDIGCLVLARTQIQKSADAAALAGTNELLEQKLRSPEPLLHVPDEEAIHKEAAKFAGENKTIGNVNGAFDLPQSAVVTGLLEDLLANPLNLLQVQSSEPGGNNSNPSEHNSVQVCASRTEALNGKVKTFFAPILGTSGVDVSAQATAAFKQNFIGFRAPRGPERSENLQLLPFALDEAAWQTAAQGVGPDQWSWDSDSREVQAGSDGRPEIRLYPLETGSTGNCGTIDIGSNNSNTPTLRRQISEGVRPTDLDFHGGELKLNGEGKLKLSADPGLKAGAIERELRSIIGKPKIIALYRSAAGGGNPAEYTVVGFAAVRVVYVKLRGADKGVIVQPAPMVTRGGIPAQPGQRGSELIYSPVVLVR